MQPGGNADREGFVLLDSRATMPTWAFVAAILLDLIAFGSDVAEFRLLSRMAAGEFVSFGEADANDTRQGLIGLVQLAVLVVAAVFFIRWFHRAYKNLPALGVTNLRDRTHGAIWSWCIPIAALFWPKRMANDIWRASDPSLPADTSDGWRDRPVPVVFLLWWLPFVASQPVYNLGFRLANAGETAAALKQASTA